MKGAMLFFIQKSFIYRLSEAKSSISKFNVEIKESESSFSIENDDVYGELT
jgi:hypothetical protein